MSQNQSGRRDSSRPYRSRKERPCDACRRRKVLCDMPNGVPCIRCIRQRHPCTFDQGPRKRLRSPFQDALPSQQTSERPWFDESPPSFSPNAFSENLLASIDLIQSADYSFICNSEHVSPINHSPNEESRSTANQESSLVAEKVHLESTETRPRQSRNRNPNGPPGRSQQSSESGDEDVRNRSQNDDTGNQASLESISDAFSFYIGPTGTSDVYLLRRQTFIENSMSTSIASGLKFQLTEKPDLRSNISLQTPWEPEAEGLGPLPPTIFGITDNNLIANAEPRAEASLHQSVWSDLWEVVEREVAFRLVRLYLRFIEPYFPILSLEQVPANPQALNSMNLALLAGICATALPYSVYDEALYRLLPRPPSSQQLYRICWQNLWQDFHAPSMGTIQACIVLQHRLPTNAVLSDTAFKWTLMSSAVAAAQTIGLHRDSSSWHLVPLNERNLRQRIWWALSSMEKWYALARGMPSHIHDDESDVKPLELQHLKGSFSNSPETQSHFYHLVTLTTLLSEIQSTFYTVRATTRVANNLHASLELARPIRARLQAWNDGLPTAVRFRSQKVDSGTQERLRPEVMARRLNANASLHLSYIVTHMTLFRALLRPLDLWAKVVKHDRPTAEAIYDIALAVVRGALLCVKELVEFMEGLTDCHWNAFWHSWSRPNFAIAGTFMVHLLQITAPEAETGVLPEEGQSHDNISHDDEDLFFSNECKELQEMIERWRWASRISVNNAAGAKGLTNLGLFKVETLLASLESNVAAEKI